MCCFWTPFSRELDLDSQRPSETVDFVGPVREEEDLPRGRFDLGPEQFFLAYPLEPVRHEDGGNALVERVQRCPRVDKRNAAHEDGLPMSVAILAVAWRKERKQKLEIRKGGHVAVFAVHTKTSDIDIIFGLSSKLSCHQMEMENWVQGLLQWRRFSNNNLCNRGLFLYIYY